MNVTKEQASDKLLMVTIIVSMYLMSKNNNKGIVKHVHSLVGACVDSARTMMIIAYIRIAS